MTVDKCILNVYILVIMQTTAIYVRTDPEIKTKAQKVAKELGFSLSSLMNAWLRQLIKSKTITFSAREDEVPSQYLINAIKKARENRKKGLGSPVFNNAKDAINYLHKQGI